MSGEKLNQVACLTVSREIDDATQTELIRIKQLFAWLYPESLCAKAADIDSCLAFRTAPSIISRSEAELFAVATPRFSYRARMLGESGPSFINARRLARMAANGAAWLEPSDYENSPKDVILRSVCIADSLFTTPLRLQKNFHILATQLFRAYGETGHDQPEPFGTPFLRHIRLGGGLCAQAVAFMATSLLQTQVKGIHGIAEITAIASENSGAGQAEIPISGLKMADMLRYFQNSEYVGLNAFLHELPASAPPPQRNKMIRALRTYLASGFPVAVPVDFGRLAGFGSECPGQVFSSNKIPLNEHPQRTPERFFRDHVVLLVGCHQTNTDGFLLNDPAVYPFIEVNFDALWRSRRYLPRATPEKPALGAFFALPVLPQGVKLPAFAFNSSLKPSGMSESLGYFDMAQMLQNPSRDQGLGLPTFPEPIYDPGENRLLPGNELLQEGSSLCQLPLLSATQREVLAKTLCDCELPPWVWMQIKQHAAGDPARIEESIWLWDATRAAPANRHYSQLRDEHLLLVLALKCDKLDYEVCFFNSPRLPAAESLPPAALPAAAAPPLSLPARPRDSLPPRTPALEASVITSFDTVTSLNAAKFWPADQRIPCELYVAMEKEARQWFRKFLGRRKTPATNHCLSAVDAMAHLADAPDAVERLADWLCKEGGFPHATRPIIGFATFFPEIASLHPVPRAKAQNALRFLFQLAEQLREREHPVKFIEIVGGSRCRGMHARQESGCRAGFWSRMGAPEDQLFRLLSSLQTVARKIQWNSGSHPPLALELEPGPLHTFNGQAAMSALCGYLKEAPEFELGDCLGFNCDISHFRMAGISPGDVIVNDEISRKLIHSHCGGHHPAGHLGDTGLLLLHPREVYTPWLEMLRHVARAPREDREPQFSGYVSLEYEAAKNGTCVRSSFQHLSDLISDVNAQELSS